MVKEVFAYLETHWDREWYKTFEEYRFRLCDVVNDIFKKLENGQINSFYFDGQTIAIDDYLEIFPEKREYVKKLVREKKLYVGPFYDLADEFLVSGESLIRNLLIGRKEALSYGMDENDFIGYLPDAFGHSSWLPMIFNKFGISKALVWRGVNNAKQEFLWCSPDNSKIKTAYLAGGYYQDFFAYKSYKKNLNKLLKKLNSLVPQNIPILLPVGADHLACEDNIKAKIKNFNRDNSDFKIKLSTLNSYYEKTKGNNNLETITGELLDNKSSCLLFGVHSSRIYLKQMNMNLEWKLSKIIEPMYALLSDELSSKKENIDYAWKMLIQNHAHDSICGCCVDAVHRENMTRYEKVEQICDTLIDNAKAKLEKKISKDKVGILNLSNFDYSGVVSYFSDKKLPLPCVGKKKAFPISISQDVHQIPIQENYSYRYEYLINVDKVKGLSFKLTEPLAEVSSVFKTTDKILENEKLFIQVNADGTLNIKNKITNKVFNNILKITDEADVGDSYNFSCIVGDNPLAAQFKNARLIENNILRKILRLTYVLNIPTHAKSDKLRSKKVLKHTFSVDLILTANTSRLDVKINYENFSKDHILKLNFKLPSVIESVVSEDTFGCVERHFEPNYDYKQKLPIPEFTELYINTNPFRRFVMTQGLCLITKGLNEYEVCRDSLNITLLRSFGIISKRRIATRAFAAGPPLPTPEGQCLGHQCAEFSLLLTDDENEAFKEADFFYNPFVVVDGSSTKNEILEEKYFDIPCGFYVYNIKEAENRDGIISKVFNNTNKNNTLSLSGDLKVYETDFIENKISEKNLSGMNLNFKPLELKVLKVQYEK